DGNNYGLQNLIDQRSGLNVTTEFIKAPEYDDVWYTKVRFRPLVNTSRNKTMSFIWQWTAGSSDDKININLSTLAKDISIAGYTAGLDINKPVQLTLDTSALKE